MAMDAFDLAERFQTLVFVMSDLDLGMNTWMSRAVRVSRQAARSRQGARRRRRSARIGDEWGRYKDVDGDGIPYRTIPGDGMPAYLHARLRPQRARAVQRAARRLRQQHGPAGAQVRDRAAACAAAGRRRARRAADRHHRLRHQPLGGRGEPRPAARRSRASRPRYLRLRAYPFTDEVADFIDALRSRLRRRAEPRRADADAAAARARPGAERRSCAACGTTTACRSTRARSPTTSSRRKASSSVASSTVATELVGQPM